MTYDPLKLSSGLLDDDDVVFRDAIFRTDPEFRDGQVLFLDATLLTSDGEEMNKFFGCGNGWETDDGGTANREDGRDIAFNKKSAIGEAFGGLLTVMKEDGKCDTAIRNRIKTFPMGPRDAGFWKGLKVHVTAQGRKGGGDVPDYEALVIDAFHGIEGDADGGTGKAKGAAKKASGATKKAAPKAAETGAEYTLPVELKAQLDALADQADSHEDFMEAAFATVPEVSSVVEVKAIVSDGGPGSLWAEAVERYSAGGGE